MARSYKRGTETRSAKVMLNSIGHVKAFVDIVEGFEADMELICGRDVINAKSMMGIFSMDLSQPIELQIHTEGEDAEEILGRLKEFIV